ncbi:MAG: outer membrane lipoprotein chaperone LolA [Woeseiaceae bacterium]|nr:outer membrane lipoprotein chaperone LolA [Woeseiaceae bacterium]
MIKQLISLLVLVLAASIAHAQSSIDDLGRKLVNDFLTNVITFESRFDQTLQDADGTIIESTSGTLEIERPKRFRWSYAEPYEQWLVADGANIWSYDLDLEQVTVKPQVEALANTPALLLGGSEDALEQFDFGDTTIEEFTTWIRLEPKNKDSGFNGVVLGFMEGQLRRMVFFDNLEQTTLIALHDVRVNEPIDSERFEFVVPVGVDLVGTPATVISEEP